MPWPVDALERVAEYFISSMKLGQSAAEDRDATTQESTDAQAADATKSVESFESKESQKSLEEVQEIVLTELEKKLVNVVMHFNQSVVDASEK